MSDYIRVLGNGLEKFRAEIKASSNLEIKGVEGTGIGYLTELLSN